MLAVLFLVMASMIWSLKRTFKKESTADGLSFSCRRCRSLGYRFSAFPSVWLLQTWKGAWGECVQVMVMVQAREAAPVTKRSCAN